MQNNTNRRFITFLLVFAVHFLFAGYSFAKSTHAHKSSDPVSQLKTGRHNSEVLVNGNNPLQLVNYRTSKTGHFLKILLIELISLIVCLKYLKNKLKGIYSEYARFLKLLLYPNHVFW
jgi:uncharacterized membrane protein